MDEDLETQPDEAGSASEGKQYLVRFYAEPPETIVVNVLPGEDPVDVALEALEALDSRQVQLVSVTEVVYDRN